MNSITTSLVVLGCMFGGALLGLRLRLPDDHKNSDAQQVVRLGMGLVGTMVAMVLGLMITSAKSFYETQNSEVVEVAADIMTLDRVLAHYGPEAQDARVTLRKAIAGQVDYISGPGSATRRLSELESSTGDALFDEIHALTPRNDYQRLLQSQASEMAIKTAQLRWLMFTQRSTAVPMPLLVIVVCWLTFLFLSYGLFVHANVTVVSSLFGSALAVSGAVFLIIEMYQPYEGLIRVSAAPLQAALAQLGR